MKGLLLLQGGRETVVPDTPSTRKFWQEYNTNISKSNIAHKKYVTILEAEPALVEKYLSPKRQPKTDKNPTAGYQAKIEQQQQEISELKTMMLRLLNANTVPAAMPQVAAEMKAPALAVTDEFVNFD